MENRTKGPSPAGSPKLKETNRRPPLIMIHGAGESAALWQDQLSGLADAAAPLAVDLPGHGARQAVAGRTSVADYARDVMETVAGFDTAATILCGHSMGGAIVLQLLLEQPKTFKAGILVNSGGRLRIHPDLMTRARRHDPGLVAASYQWSVSPAKQNPAMQARFDRICDCPPAVREGDYTACDEFDVLERIDRIAVPVLVVASTLDRLTPLKYSSFMAEKIPGASLKLIEGVGHFTPLEDPTALNRIIADFIATLG